MRLLAILLAIGTRVLLALGAAVGSGNETYHESTGELTASFKKHDSGSIKADKKGALLPSPFQTAYLASRRHDDMGLSLSLCHAGLLTLLAPAQGSSAASSPLRPRAMLRA